MNIHAVPTDEPLTLVAEAICLSRSSLTDRHRWSRKERAYIEQGIGYLQRAIGELENIEIEGIK